MNNDLITASVLVLVGLAAGISAAQAADAGTPLLQTVAYGDLNLDSNQGAKVFYSRVTLAARRVCSPLDRADVALTQKWQTCYDDAVARAVATVDKSKVTALYHGPKKLTDAPTLAALR